MGEVCPQYRLCFRSFRNWQCNLIYICPFHICQIKVSTWKDVNPKPFILASASHFSAGLYQYSSPRELETSHGRVCQGKSGDMHQAREWDRWDGMPESVCVLNDYWMQERVNNKGILGMRVVLLLLCLIIPRNPCHTLVSRLVVRDGGIMPRPILSSRDPVRILLPPTGAM